MEEYEGIRCNVMRENQQYGSVGYCIGTLVTDVIRKRVHWKRTDIIIESDLFQDHSKVTHSDKMKTQVLKEFVCPALYSH